MRIHRCPDCTYFSLSKYNLNRHINSNHIQSQPRKTDDTVCEYCSKKFTNAYNCRRHMMQSCKMRSSCPNVGDVCPNVGEAGENVNLAGENVNLAGENVNLAGENVNLAGENVNLTGECNEQQNLLYHCKTCYKTFRTERFLANHIPNCKNIKHPFECYKCHKLLSCKESKCKHLKICKGISSELVVVTNSNINANANKPITELPKNNQAVMNQNNSHIQQQQNIQHQQNIQNQQNIYINNYGSESWNHVTNEFLDNCIRAAIRGIGVKNLIRNVHFNPDVPENHNIRLKNVRQELLEVFEKDKWEIADKSTLLDELIVKACNKLTLHYHSNPLLQTEDIRENSQMYIMNLKKIRERTPSVYYSLKRQLFVMILNLTKSNQEPIIE